MKKTIAITVVLLILLTACQTVPVIESGTASSTPTSSSIVPPSSSAVPATSTPVTAPSATSTPPTTSIPATYAPATNPNYTGGDIEEMEGHAFIFSGRQPIMEFEVDLTKLVEGWLYYVDYETQVITPICEETIVALTKDDFDTDFVYYVKASEPTKVYCTNQRNPEAHTMAYESTFGPVNDITISKYAITKQKVLQFVADNKYFVVLDLETRETSLVMEQYYIEYALIAHGSYDTWTDLDLVLFRGKLNEDDKVGTYEYSRFTGVIQDMDD